MLALFRDFSWVYLLCLHAVLDALLINKVYFLLLPMYVIIGLNWEQGLPFKFTCIISLVDKQGLPFTFTRSHVGNRIKLAL